MQAFSSKKNKEDSKRGGNKSIAETNLIYK